MENYKPSNEIKGAIKNVIRSYIIKSDAFTKEQKRIALEELGTNWVDDRFDDKEFIKEAIYFSVETWKEQNFNLTEFWKNIAIENSKINNEPHLVANNALEEFKKQFNLL